MPIPPVSLWDVLADPFMWMLVVWFVFASLIAWVLGGSDG